MSEAEKSQVTTEGAQIDAETTQASVTHLGLLVPYDSIVEAALVERVCNQSDGRCLEESTHQVCGECLNDEAHQGTLLDEEVVLTTVVAGLP